MGRTLGSLVEGSFFDNARGKSSRNQHHGYVVTQLISYSTEWIPSKLAFWEVPKAKKLEETLLQAADVSVPGPSGGFCSR